MRGWEKPAHLNQTETIFAFHLSTVGSWSSLFEPCISNKTSKEEKIYQRKASHCVKLLQSSAFNGCGVSVLLVPGWAPHGQMRLIPGRGADSQSREEGQGSGTFKNIGFWFSVLLFLLMYAEKQSSLSQKAEGRWPVDLSGQSNKHFTCVAHKS